MLAVQARSGHSYSFWRPVNEESKLVDEALIALSKVGLQERANHQASEVSHGEHRQLEIAMALAMEPTLLLLDEPMAGLGIDETRKMIDILKTLKGEKTVLLIEHDMDAVFSLADQISVLVNGKVLATGSQQDIQSNAEVQAAYLGET